MGKLEEFLAGCPKREAPDKKKMPWQSFRAFPGVMVNRMYILFSRPKVAIGEFGAADYKIPFWFFLFFTIILAFLQNLASLLKMSFFGMFPMYQPSMSEALDIFFSNSVWVLVLGTFYHTIYQLMFLGLSVIILALLLWCITGVRSWNPAFTISAYCLPVRTLLFTVLAFVQIPWMYNDPLSDVLGLAFTAIGIIITLVIAGYGIVALTKTPLITAVIVTLSWIIIGMLVTGAAWDFVILPIESGFRLMISQTFFPHSFPTAAVLGKNP
jgi:hypothetical protein